MANYLHAEGNSEQINDILHAAVNATKPEQDAFREAVIARERLKQSSGLPDDAFNRLAASLIQHSNEPTAVPLNGEEKANIRQKEADFLANKIAFYKALSAAINAQGLHADCDSPTLNTMFHSATPKGQVSNHGLAFYIMQSIQARAIQFGAQPSQQERY
ncbi:MAG: hypothetical protein V4735_00385 [Pseudomonadota bacterium]